MVKKEKDVKLAWIFVGVVVIFYNQIQQFFASFGFAEVSVNLLLLFLVLAVTYYRTPYIERMLQAKIKM